MQRGDFRDVGEDEGVPRTRHSTAGFARQRYQPALFALALAFISGVANAQSFTPAGTTGPAVIELGQSHEGGLTYLVHGYVAAGGALNSLAGLVGGDFSFRVGGYCVDTPEASLVPTGVSGNTTAWSYNLTAITVSLVEDAPKGSCNYTVKVSYTLSLTGAVSINQMEYAVYLRGRTAPPATAGLTAIR